MTLALPDAPPETVVKKLKPGPNASVATLRDVLVVTYAVPEDLVKPHVPPGLNLDRLPSETGEMLAFVQTVCAYHDAARWSLLPSDLGQSYHQISHRVLTRVGGKKGAFALRTYLSTGEAHIPQRALSRDADFARFWVYINGNPARAGAYESYSLRAVGDLGQVNLEVRAHQEGETAPLAFPFKSVGEMAEFFVQRDETYFRASAPRATSIGVASTTVDVGTGEDAVPQTGQLVSARQTLWAELGIVSAPAQNEPTSVLLYKAWQVTTRPPRFAKLSPGALVSDEPMQNEAPTE